jgi:biopolymer transport protein ExbD
MAEIQSQTGDNRKKGAVRRSKKLSTKVDLTPMVDLGFLLITFFILTTTWGEAKSMKFFMPKGDTATMPVASSTALTVIPIASDKVFYYHGEPAEFLSTGTYGTSSYNIETGIGNIIRQKQAQLSRTPGFTAKDLMLVIKPADESSYKNLVDVMDEVLINRVSRYAVVDLSEEEKTLIEKYAR